jgi:hypothetical protein
MTNTEASRKNITQPSDWWVAFEDQASKCNMTLSAWIGDCCCANLPVKVQKKLSERPPAHRPSRE